MIRRMDGKMKKGGRNGRIAMTLLGLAMFIQGAWGYLNDPEQVVVANEPRLQVGTVTAERLGSIFDACAGPFATARAGDWRLSNEHIAVTFAAVDPTTSGVKRVSMPTNGYRKSAGGAPQPGSVLDFTVDGDSLDFVLAFTQYAGLEPRGNPIPYDSIKPVQKGEAAGLELEGSPFDNSPVRVRTTYLLSPESYRLVVESEVLDLPEGEQPPVIGDLGSWGFGTPIINKVGEIYGTGQKEPMDADFFQVYGGNQCIALQAAEGTQLHGTYMGPPFVTNTCFVPVKADQQTTAGQSGVTTGTLAQTGTTTQTAAAVQPITGTVRRALWVARSTPGQQLEKMQAARNVPTGRTTGTVLSSDGKTSLADAAVVVRWTDPQASRPPVVYTRLKTDKEGRYSIDLPTNGFYSFIPEPKSKTVVGTSTLRPGFPPIIGQVRRVNLNMSPESGVRVRTLDATTSRPLAARLQVEPIPPNQPINFGFPLSAREGYLEYSYIPPEGKVIYLPPGRWVIKASHGITYDMGDRDVTVEPGKIAELTFGLKQTSPSPGWTHVELGMRTHATPGCMIEPRDIALMCAAEGIGWVVSGDYEKLTDLRPAIAEQGLDGLLGASRGFRTTLPAHPEWGQFLVYPVAEGAPDPQQARKEWAGLKTAKDFIATLRRLYPGALIQSELPYTEDGLGYFAIKDRDPFIFAWFPREDIELAIDSVNLYPARTALDFKLTKTFWTNHMARGRKYLITGSNTGTTVMGGEPGYPRLLAYLGEKVKPTEATVRDALKAGRAQVTSGPFIDFRIRGDVVPGDRVEANLAYKVQLRVTAPKWIDTSSMELCKETNQRFSMMITSDAEESNVRFPQSDVEEEVGNWTLDTMWLNEERDTLLGAEVKGAGFKNLLPNLATIEEVYPFAVTMPIEIDMNKNGKFDPLAFPRELGT